MGAVRYFLRVDPESLERKDEDDEARFSRSLGIDFGSYKADPHLPEAWYVLSSSQVGKESVPIYRPTWDLTVWRHPIAVEALGSKTDFNFATFEIRVYKPGCGL